MKYKAFINSSLKAALPIGCLVFPLSVFADTATNTAAADDADKIGHVFNVLILHQT